MIAAIAVSAGLVAAGRVPAVQRTRVGPYLAAAERGARRVFGAPRLRGVLLRIVVAWCLVLVVPSYARVVAVLLLLWLVGRTRQKRPEVKGWWSHSELLRAMTLAGILPKLREGEPPPMLSYRGAVAHAERATSVCVALPGARGLADVVRNRDSLAAALRVDPDRFEVDRPPGTPGNVVRLTVLAVRDTTTRHADVATATRTDWSRPVVLGVDDRGREVTFQTTQTHSVLAGATGSGKTVLAHLIAGHAALDSRVRIFGIDGKGDAGPKGWQPLEPRCEMFVRGMGADSPARIEAMLTEVTALSEQRGEAGDEDPEVVLILEEWATARSVLRRLDAKAADRCDAMVTVLLATARSHGIHLILITQRGTTESLPGEQRANIGQRVVGKFGDSKEAGYVLEKPPARLPTHTGEFALSLDMKAPSLVTVDYLADSAWKALCARAAPLRPTPAPMGPMGSRTAATVPQRAPELPTNVGIRREPHGAPVTEALDPLLTEVLRILADADPRGLPASALLELLPDWLRPTTARDLGVALARFPDHLERRQVRSTKVWRATACAPPAPPHAHPLRTDCAPPAHPVAGGRNGPVSRSKGPADRERRP